MLAKNTLIDDNYTVQFLIKTGPKADAYRVKGKDNKNYFLKRVILAKLKQYEFDTRDNLLEFEIVKSINHPNIIKYLNNGEVTLNNQKYAYLVLEFISGENLSEVLHRNLPLDSYDVIQFTLGVLNALKYLHSLPIPVIHNAVTPENIMIDISGKISVAKLAGFSHARYSNQPRTSFNSDGVSPFYMSNECFNKVFSIQSDIFSIGALMYNLVYGIPPWYIDLKQVNQKEVITTILNERRKPLKIVDIPNDKIEIQPSFMTIMEKCLQNDVTLRYQNVDELVMDLTAELECKSNLIEKSGEATTGSQSYTFKTNTDDNCGFAKIAGMNELKETLINDVIKILADPEGAAEYGLSIPNGILLFGPPGCGKTFIAEKFAEEANFNYCFIKSSDLGSIYIHGSQDKIGNLFKESKAKKPSIICFDEFDSLVPIRGGFENSSRDGEVNEFLTQLNNCGKSGIMVIGTTNRPDLIDPAVLRKGRIDKVIYVPPPDYEARVGLFKLYLDGKPVDFGIDYEELATKSERYVASDIEYIVVETARCAYRNKTRITHSDILNTLSKTNPSVSNVDLEKYENLRIEIEGLDKKQFKTKSLGFRQD
jgi:transitional endoplasmic reticulum ATPase